MLFIVLYLYGYNLLFIFCLYLIDYVLSSYFVVVKMAEPGDPGRAEAQAGHGQPKLLQNCSTG